MFCPALVFLFEYDIELLFYKINSLLLTGSRLVGICWIRNSYRNIVYYINFIIIVLWTIYFYNFLFFKYFEWNSRLQFRAILGFIFTFQVCHLTFMVIGLLLVHDYLSDYRKLAYSMSLSLQKENLHKICNEYELLLCIKNIVKFCIANFTQI